MNDEMNALIERIKNLANEANERQVAANRASDAAWKIARESGNEKDLVEAAKEATRAAKLQNRANENSGWKLAEIAGTLNKNRVPLR